MLENVRDTYDAIGDEFDRTRQESVAEFGFYAPHVKPEAFIADLGCGNGRLLKSLRGNDSNYTGIDNSNKMLEVARRNHPRNKFIRGDFLDIPLKDGSQNVVFALRSFHHLPDHTTRLKALAEIRRVLQTNGTMIMSVWNLWQWKNSALILKAIIRFIYSFGNWGVNDLLIPWGKRQKRYYHAFTPSEIADLVKEAGFEIEEEFCVRKGNKVPFKNSHDIVIIARKLEV